MLGKDVDRNEYWFFKEEPGKLFLKQIEKPQVNYEDEAAMEEVVYVEPKVYWFYYDEEEEMEKLIETLNPKGIREKKLQENLKKIADKVKLKKTRKAATVSTAKNTSEEKNQD